MQEISKASQENTQDVWGIIAKCSSWLSTRGLNHWTGYYTEDLITHKLENQSVYLVKENNLPIGTITLDTNKVDYYNAENMACFSEPEAKALYVTTLGVLPEYQGQGVATKMLEFADSEAKKQNINFVRFDCRTSYKELVAFYQKRGYKIVGQLLDTEDNNEPYCLMEKRIS